MLNLVSCSADILFILRIRYIYQFLSVFTLLNIALFIVYVYSYIFNLNFIIFILNNFITSRPLLIGILILLPLIIVYNVLSLYNQCTSCKHH